MADTKTTREDAALLLRHPQRGALLSGGSRRILPALVVLLALAGCRYGGNTADMPVGSASARGASPAATLPELEARNLVTPETAGKPVLDLRFGEPVSVHKGGITLVIAPKSLAKLDGDPPDLSSNTTPGKNCHAWWKLSYEVVVDARPDAGWKDWLVAFKGFDVLQRSEEHPRVPADDFGSGPDQLLRLVSAAESERRKNPGAPFRKALESKQYADMCADGLSGEPSGLEPVGVELGASVLRDGDFGKPIARWLL